MSEAQGRQVGSASQVQQRAIHALGRSLADRDRMQQQANAEAARVHRAWEQYDQAREARHREMVDAVRAERDALHQQLVDAQRHVADLERARAEQQRRDAVEAQRWRSVRDQANGQALNRGVLAIALGFVAAWFITGGWA